MSAQINLRIKAIAATIRQKREYRNYTQEYLAFKLNISQNAYSKIELGYTKLTLERLFQIAEVLEFKPCELIDPEQDDVPGLKLLNTGTD
jgi:transcriptional regulator with XRE-family HTH domain